MKSNGGTPRLHGKSPRCARRPTDLQRGHTCFFGECREVEDVFDVGVDSGVVDETHLADVNHLGCERADNVNAANDPIRRGDHFWRPSAAFEMCPRAISLDDPTTHRCSASALLARLARHTPSPALSRFPMAATLARVDTEQVACCTPALLHRGRCEGRANDVTGRIDVRCGRSVTSMRPRASTFTPARSTCRSSIIDTRPSAQSTFSLTTVRPSPSRVRGCRRTPLLRSSHRRHIGRLLRRTRREEAGDQLLVDETERPSHDRSRRDANAEHREDRRVFARDHSTAEHDQRFGRYANESIESLS